MGAAIGVELDAAGPRREEGERLPVVNVEAFEADGVREVLLGGDLVGIVGDGIESVEREEFRRGFEHGAAEEIPDVAPEDSDRDEADTIEIVFEGELGAARFPRFDAGVVDGDTIGRARDGFEVGQRETAGVLVEIGAAEREIVGAAGDEIFEDRVARVYTREEAEVFLFRMETAVEEGEFRNRQRLAGEGEWAGVGAEDHFARCVALVVARGIGERALGGDVGLLGAGATGEFETAVKETQVATKVGGGDPFLRVLGVCDAGAVGGIFIADERGGAGDEEIAQGFVTHPLNARKTVGAGAQRDVAIHDDVRHVVAAGGGRRGGAAIGADEIEVRGYGAVVATGLTEIQARLDGERPASVEIAAGIGEGGAVLADRALGRGARSAQGVTTQIVGIDLSAGDAVGHRDLAGAEIKNLVERNRHAGAAREGRVEVALVEVAKAIRGPRIAEADFAFPDWAIVAVGQRGHDRRAQAIASVGRLTHFTGAREAVGEGRGELSDEHAVHGERHVPLVVVGVERAVLKCEREAIVAAQAVVKRGSERRAVAAGRAVAHQIVGQVRPVRGGVGERRAVGGGAAPAPRVLHVGLGGILGGGAAGNREAEFFVYGHDPGKFETGLNLARALGARAGGLVEVAGIVAHDDVHAAGKHRPRALEGAAGDEIHGAGEGGAGRLGRRRERGLDAGHIINRNGIEFDVAAGAGDFGGGEAEAADGDGDIG